jgi:acyl-CoA reductase-like NAD-dependent aldehyde dehydrogenase
MSRLPVKKTYKLYVGGSFPRSESGRTYEVEGANVALASRKDVRDAVRAARAAFPGWAGITAYNRGQVLYRVAEMMEGRKAEFAELTGVVGIVAAEDPPLLGLVSRLAPAVVGGNAAVVIASEHRPLAAVTLAEVLATSDVPGGVVNVLTGRKRELTPVLAGHMDVNAIDLAGATDDLAELERIAADNVKRIVRNGDGQSPWHAASFLELKTVWHPIGV